MPKISTKKIASKTLSQDICGSLGMRTMCGSVGGQGAIPIRDHSKLSNLEYAKSGHIGFAGIEFGTTAEWNANPQYRPAEGMLVVYTDYESYVDEHGETVYVPGFKIGDGNAYLIDKPFVGEADRQLLNEHIQNTEVHIQPGERIFWNNKLNYEEPESDLLVFTRN